MRNPYQILGVSETASMDEVKKAYRKLSRIYHPDANVNNPNKDQAEAKFKEIQAAYQQIEQRNTSGQGSYQQYYGGFEDFFGGFGFGGQSGQYRQESTDSTLMQAAANYLRNGYYREALNVLNNVPVAERNAKWYYYSAQANAGTGNNITAQEHARTAVQLEPNNYVYQELLRRMQSGESWYTQRGSTYGRSAGSFYSCCSCCCEWLMIPVFCRICC